MVATLVRLRLRILGHALRRDTWRLVLLILGLLWGLSLLPGLAGAMLWLAREPAEFATEILVVAGSLVVAGWAVVPLLVPGMDDSLDISRFATAGQPARRLAPGLLVAGALTVPTLVTAGATAAPLLIWLRHGTAASLTAVAGAVLAVVTCLLAARIATGVSARVLASRRAREVGATVGVLLAVLAVPGVVALGSLGLEGALEKVPTVARVLGWTPLGAPFAAPLAAAEGSLGEALARLGVALAGIGAAFALWVHLLGRALRRPVSRGGAARRRADRIVRGLRRLPRRPGLLATLAVARRGARYWSADPRYLSALLGAVVTPALVVVLGSAISDTPGTVALGAGAFVGGTLGWGRHNDVAYDGSAFWLHVAARVPGWADRLGRTLATLVWALPVTLAAGVAGVALSGRWDVAPAALGAAVGLLLGGLGVSAVASATLPYPVPEAGANPFAAQIGGVGASLVAQVATSTATFLVCSPVLALAALTVWREPRLGGATLAVGMVGGVVALALGIVLGGRLYDERAPRLLARLT